LVPSQTPPSAAACWRWQSAPSGSRLFSLAPAPPSPPSSIYAAPTPSALQGFLELDCDEQLAGWLRAEVEAAQGAGYDHFEFNLFDVELFYAENRVRIADATALGYDDAELTLSEFLAAIPDVPPGPRMPGRPRRVIVPPPPSVE